MSNAFGLDTSAANPSHVEGKSYEALLEEREVEVTDLVRTVRDLIAVCALRGMSIEGYGGGSINRAKDHRAWFALEDLNGQAATGSLYLLERGKSMHPGSCQASYLHVVITHDTVLAAK